MTIDLTGLHLLVTRPEEQAIPWAERLQAMGAEVTLRPVLAIVPVTTAAEKQTITNQILNLDNYQKAIFVSQSAVRYGSEWITDYWPQLPMGVKFFAVGEATKNALADSLEHLGLQIDAPQIAMNSEALLALPALHQVDKEKVIIFRGVGGRAFLAGELQKRGAQVDYIELYYRTKPERLDSLTAFKMSPQAVTVVHSGESLENLCTLCNRDDLQWLQQHPLLVPGERVANIARQKGFTTIIEAVNATHQSMTEALYDWRQR